MGVSASVTVRFKQFQVGQRPSPVTFWSHFAVSPSHKKKQKSTTTTRQTPQTTHQKTTTTHQKGSKHFAFLELWSSSLRGRDGFRLFRPCSQQPQALDRPANSSDRRQRCQQGRGWKGVEKVKIYLVLLFFFF